MTIFELTDEEFGIVAIRCNPRAQRVILRVKPDASVHITVPHKRHLDVAEKLLNDSRTKVRSQRRDLLQNAPVFAPGSMVGRSHQLVFRVFTGSAITTRVNDDQIIVKYPLDLTPDHPEVQAKVRVAVKKALRRQAEDYLPRYLARLAHQWGFSYRAARITSGHTRWGSCSGDNEISLNLSLMNLPDYLIEYVICHELCHTVEHNHSDRFWALVAQHIPQWRELRKELKSQHPA